MEAVLRQLLGRDTPRVLSLEPETEGDFPGLLGQDVDASLREALHRGLIEGERVLAAGPGIDWVNLRLRVEGLQALGEWPPPEGEHLPGPWDEGYWGERALPRLKHLSDNPPQQGFIFGPHGGMDDERWGKWIAALRLYEAGLIDGDLQSGGLSDVRVTDAGARTLDPPDRDPLSVAAVALRRGSKADATIAAVEEALGGRLKELAVTRGVAVDDRRGPKKLIALNGDLKRAGAYDEAERAQVEAWLKLRNEVGHGRGEDVSARRIETMLTGIAVFLDEHPSASPS